MPRPISPDGQQRLIVLSYLTLGCVVLSILLAVGSQISQATRGEAEIGNLRTEMVEIKHQMAERSELQAVRQSLLRLEKDVRKLSDKLPHGR